MKYVVYTLCLFSFFYSHLNVEKASQINSKKILQFPSLDHIFGTDFLGRDIFVQSFLAMEDTLKSVLIAITFIGIFSFILAVIILLNSKLIQSAVLYILDLLDGLPNFLISIIGILIFNRWFDWDSHKVFSFIILGFSIAIAVVPGMAKSIYFEILQYRQLEFVWATRAIGASEKQIIHYHYWPHIRTWLKLSILQLLPGLIGAETFLSFLGASRLGSVGQMLFEGWKQSLDSPQLFFGPAFSLLITLVTLNIFFQPEMDGQ